MTKGQILFSGTLGLVAIVGCGAVDAPSADEATTQQAVEPTPSPHCTTTQFGYCFISRCVIQYPSGNTYSYTTCADVYGPIDCNQPKCGSPQGHPAF
jgi:hypothetical protein